MRLEGRTARPGRTLAIAGAVSVVVHVLIATALYVGVGAPPDTPAPEPIRVVIVRPEPRTAVAEPVVEAPVQEASPVRAPIARRQVAEHVVTAPGRPMADRTESPEHTPVTESARTPHVPPPDDTLQTDEVVVALPDDMHEDRPGRVVELHQPPYPAASVRRGEEG
ncbi:MAG: hypothetical protein KDA28_04960, partial [Phycisphaerales bacterium]|nr:hypothetical protein [Phycisphaerales bacterium]